MIALLAFTLALSAPQAQAQADPSAALRPDTIIAPLGRPKIVLLGTRPGGVTALRLAIPLQDGDHEAGAGRLLAELALERMRGAAAQVGARVAAERTPWGLAYTVAGAGVDIEYLGSLLRTATEEPGMDRVRLGRIQDALLREIERYGESPSDRLSEALRSMAAPGRPPLDGTAETVALLDAGRLRDVWRRSHVASAMTIVAVTDADPTVVMATLSDIGMPGDPPDPREASAATEGPRRRAPPIIRNWVGVTYVGTHGWDAEAAIAARLLAPRLRSTPAGMEVSVRLVELASGHALAISGSAHGRKAPLVAYVGSILPGLAGELDATLVQDALVATRREYLRSAGTPWGLAEKVGRAMEATGDPAAAARYLADLSAVTADRLASYLAGLGGPLSADLSR